MIIIEILETIKLKEPRKVLNQIKLQEKAKIKMIIEDLLNLLIQQKLVKLQKTHHIQLIKKLLTKKKNMMDIMHLQLI